MELKYFKLIKTIAEEGSMANSSERLFLTQSALSHQLRELEEQLGFKVFVRSRNKWQLTREGEELYQLSNNVLKTISEGFKNIENIQGGSRGKIRISTECYTFYHGLPAFIQKMGMLYPEIEIDMLVEATNTPVMKILNNELDMALVTTKPEDAELVSYELFSDEILALVHCENVLAKSPYLEARQFENVQLIIHSYPLETVSVYERFLKLHGVRPLKISAIPLTEVALEMVSANMGVTCLPKWALSHFEIPRDVEFKRLGKNGLKRKHYLVLRKADEPKKYMHDFIMNMQEVFVGE